MTLLCCDRTRKQEHSTIALPSVRFRDLDAQAPSRPVAQSSEGSHTLGHGPDSTDRAWKFVGVPVFLCLAAMSHVGARFGGWQGLVPRFVGGLTLRGSIRGVHCWSLGGPLA
jgi:hypothetical protein